MSLKAAIEEIAEEMLNYVEGAGKPLPVEVKMLIVSWSAQLKVAIKAAGDAPALHPLPNTHSVPVSPEVQHAQMIEGFRSEFRKEGFTQESRRIKREEQSDPRMVECHGGSFDGTIQPLDPNMPEGAFTRIGGETYKLTGGKLQYQPS